MIFPVDTFMPTLDGRTDRSPEMSPAMAKGEFMEDAVNGSPETRETKHEIASRKARKVFIVWSPYVKQARFNDRFDGQSIGA